MHRWIIPRAGSAKPPFGGSLYNRRDLSEGELQRKMADIVARGEQIFMARHEKLGS